MPVTETSAQLRRPVLRPPEKHQPAFSNIMLPAEHDLSTEAIAEIADLLKLTADDLARIVAENTPLPIAFTASREEAELVVNRLRDLGLQTLVLGDDDELGRSSVKRVKAMTLDGRAMTFQQPGTREVVDVRWQDLALIVTGRLFIRRLEIQERKTRRAENEIVQSNEFSSDEAVIDLYTSTDSQTWRLNANGFDFSCLGAQKALIANENIETLQQLIAANTSTAKLDDSYRRLRRTLDLVWGPQQETQSSGWRRERPGKLSVGLATIHSNEDQFTRYSRMRRYFHLNHVAV